MDIYDYLKKDQKKVSDLFDRILATNNNQSRAELIEEVKWELLLQASTDDTSFFDALRHFKANTQKIEQEECKRSGAPMPEDEWIDEWVDFTRSVQAKT
jgi:hypothetical protein